MTFFRTAILLTLALGLGACGYHQSAPKQSIGTLLGGVGGAVAGAQFGHGRGQLAATAAGTLLGAMIGSSVGRSLDRADRIYAARAEQDALEHAPTGGQTSWRNPDTDNYGTVTPLRTYQSDYGAYCREYQHTIYVGGRAQEGYGHACRQPDGSWRIAG